MEIYAPLSQDDDQEESLKAHEMHQTPRSNFEQQKDLYSRVKRKWQTRCMASKERMQELHGSSCLMQNRIGGSVILNGADTQKMAPFRGTMQREGTMLRQTSGSKLLTSMQASQNKLKQLPLEKSRRWLEGQKSKEYTSTNDTLIENPDSNHETLKNYIKSNVQEETCLEQWPRGQSRGRSRKKWFDGRWPRKRSRSPSRK